MKKLRTTSLIISESVMNKMTWNVEGFIGNCWQQIASRDTWREAWALFTYLAENEKEHIYRVIRRNSNGIRSDYYQTN